MQTWDYIDFFKIRMTLITSIYFRPFQPFHPPLLGLCPVVYAPAAPRNVPSKSTWKETIHLPGAMDMDDGNWTKFSNCIPIQDDIFPCDIQELVYFCYIMCCIDLIYYICWRIYARLYPMLYTLVYIWDMLVIFNSQSHRPFISGSISYSPNGHLSSRWTPKNGGWLGTAMVCLEAARFWRLSSASSCLQEGLRVSWLCALLSFFLRSWFLVVGAELWFYPFVSRFLVFSWLNGEPRSYQELSKQLVLIVGLDGGRCQPKE